MALNPDGTTQRFQVSGQPFLTLEHVAGGSLADKVGKPMPPRDAAQSLAVATQFRIF